jgi:gamma-D-glutamyl-L-lysine dipeptidyl-peptidase
MPKNFHYYVASPVLNMRKTANSKAEVVSQGLFSEEIQILERKGEWLQIKTLVDQYVGWVKQEGIHAQDRPLLGSHTHSTLITTRLATHLYEEPDTIYGPVLTVPFESCLEAVDFKRDDSRWIAAKLPDGKCVYVQRGDLQALEHRSFMTCEQMCGFSYSFLGLPYTWGGRSSFGYDCSGFVQMLYRQMGIFLPRDSKDQCMDSRFVDVAVEALVSGDLIFFGFARDQIKHVGLSLGQGSFIHTSAVTENKPYLRLSHIDDPAWNGSGYYPFRLGRRRRV